VGALIVTLTTRPSAATVHVKAPAAKALAMLERSKLRFDGGDPRDAARFFATMTSSI